MCSTCVKMNKEVILPIIASVSTYFLDIWFGFDDEIEDESDEEELVDQFIRRLENRVANENTQPNRISSYFEVVIPNYTSKEFQSHFRVSIPAFEALCEKVCASLKSRTVAGRQTTDERKQLLAVLWLLATPESFRSVGDRFNMGKSTLSACFFRVIKSINSIAGNVITWPTGARARRVELDFRKWSNLEGVIGAIDGTYVPIKAPKANPENYINRKCFYAITLQAICDSNLKFTNCFAGFPSSVGDLRIFKNSDIYENFLNNPGQYFQDGHYIIGDKAYPVLQWCIPPYIDRGNLTATEINFNSAHARTRQVIERAFALLFGRFRRLKYLDMNRVDLIPATVLACCVLHNICLDYTDGLMDNYMQEGAPLVHGDPNENVRNAANEENLHIEGLTFRDHLARIVYRQD